MLLVLVSSDGRDGHCWLVVMVWMDIVGYWLVVMVGMDIGHNQENLSKTI